MNVLTALRKHLALYAVFSVFALSCATSGTAGAAGELAGPPRPSSGVESAKEAQAPQSVLTAEAEGAGLYKKPADGSLGRNFWQGMRRSAAVKLLKAMPASSPEPAAQKLIFGALLTETDIGKLEPENQPPAPGEDLLTLRLEKLIEGGAYQQALELYSSLSLENPPESVARAGILAMLFTGQKPLACLEQNTVQSLYPHSAFLKTLGAYCEATNSKTPLPDSWRTLETSEHKALLALAKKKFEYVYEPASFSNFTLLERAIITAEGKIAINASAESMFREIPPADIQILMKANNLGAKEKFILNVRALDWGLIGAANFKKNYASAIDPDLRLDKGLKVPEGVSDWEKLPYYLQIAANSENDVTRWAHIRSAIVVGQKYGISSLLPFSGLVYKLAPADASFHEMKACAGILNASGMGIPPQWIDIIEKFSPSPAERAEYAHLLAAAYVSAGKSINDKARVRIFSYLSDAEASSTYLLKKVIENLDNSKKETHNPPVIYEKDGDLTFFKDYVMPSEAVWDRLLQAARQGLPGETVLLSATALRGAALEQIYPELFRDILVSLKNVGLTDISDNLAISAALGSSEK